MKKNQKAKRGFNSASQVFRGALISALADAEVENMIVNVWDAKFNKVREIVGIHCGQWISEYDLNNLIGDKVFHRLFSVNALDSPLQLSAHLSEADIANIADEIVDVLKKMPCQYDILFPLPHLQLMEDCTLVTETPQVSLCRLPLRALPALRDPQAPVTLSDLARGTIAISTTDTPMRMFLKVRASGYATTSRTVSAMHEAMAILKRVVQSGVTKTVFTKALPRSQILASALRGHDSQPVLEALVYDVTVEESAPLVVKLGLSMSSYLNQITIRDDWSNWSVEEPQPNAIDQFFVKHMSLPVGLLVSSSTAADSAALRSAFEWAFDAAADDEAIGACIKTCIALEAALGEDSEERGITERMADRVAYLIGNAPDNRKLLRDSVRDFYKLRSNLVHGKQAIISPRDHAIDSDGKSILHMVLTKELRSLERWWCRHHP